MHESEDSLVEILRQRIQRAVQAGVLEAGARLPSARSLQTELGIDHRAVLAAYRELVAEGLVEMRSRGGIYLAPRAVSRNGIPALPESWIVEVLASGVTREIPITELHEWLRRSVETLRLRAVAFESTRDQALGLCRELQDEYGLEAAAEDVAALSGELSINVRRADLLVTTTRHEGVVRQVAEQLGKHCVVASVRPDVITGQWLMLLEAPVYVVMADRGFADTLGQFFAGTRGAHNLRPIIVGEDDLSSIPPNAPTYVTRGAQVKLDGQRINGRIIPAPRLFSNASAREIISFIVRANLNAVRTGA
jgi:DNA-binding transcriptional regulator YhcF (GntR family)